MSANFPECSSSTPAQQNSKPAQSDKPATGESEAMRRMQDLLAAGKLSISDIVVFDYHHYSFTACIMDDGALKSNLHRTETGAHTANTAHQLYSSPSEFASAMAARAALLDETVAKTKGKLSINGWTGCTVNGRSLATIRNEMLHERKNELASLSTGKVKQSGPTISTGARPEPEQLPLLSERSLADKSTGLSVLSQSLEKSSRGGAENISGGAPSAAETGKNEPGNITDGITVEEQTGPILVQNQNAVPSSGKGLEAFAFPSSRPSNKPAGQRTISPPKLSLYQTSARKVEDVIDPHDASCQQTVPHLQVQQENLVSRSTDERSVGKDATKSGTDLSKDKLTRETVVDSPQPEGGHDLFSTDEFRLKEHSDKKEDAKKVANVEVRSLPVANSVPQTKTPELHQNNCNYRVCEHGRNRELDELFIATSSPKGPTDLTNELESSPQKSEYSKGKRSDRVMSAGPCEEICRARQKTSISETKSNKEVSDLQQEILGDSESDEESLLEEKMRTTRFAKKRSRSPSVEANRKKTRVGGYPGEDDAEPIPEKLEGLNGSENRLKTNNTKADIEAMHLDPDTVEAAAIAAQIEKEEASTRARRTTRLAAGKIKQVDYKASTGVHFPRSVSPEHGSEENNRRSNENETSGDIVRTTRRRSAPNQLPPQRSSRRVAKLRNSYEKEMSLNEEISYQGAHSAGGNEIDTRTDRENIHSENTEGLRGQGSRVNGLRSDGGDRRRGRIESSLRRSRHLIHEEVDPDSYGRAYSTRASTRENSVDVVEMTDLVDSDDCMSDVEDLQDVSAPDNESNVYGLNATDIKCLAEAIRSCKTIDMKTVLSLLSEQGSWKSDDVKNNKIRELLREASASVLKLSKPCMTQKDAVSPEQVLSFLSTEIWRLSTGEVSNGACRRPMALVRKATKEDQLRSTSEKSRRKEHRDVEELRASLEKEMESRRRAELDTLFIEIFFSEVSRAAEREKAKCYRLDQETEKYKVMEQMSRKRLEKAKILVSQLRGGKDEVDAVSGNAGRMLLQSDTGRNESLTNGSFALSSVCTVRNNSAADDDMELADKNITTTSRRLMEMDRLRVLIAAREAEAEEFQRICEKERMRFVTKSEQKARIETEIYLHKSQGSVIPGIGNLSTLPQSGCTAKESLKKGDMRTALSHTSRGSGYAKQKAGFGKGATAVPGVNNQKSHLPANRPKSGKTTEVSKQVKRKPLGRNGGNGSDKP